MGFAPRPLPVATGSAAGAAAGEGLGAAAGLWVGPIVLDELKLGIAPKANDNVERCCGSGRAVGLGNIKLAVAGVVAVAACTLTRDFTCTFKLETVVWIPPAFCAA